MKPWYEYNALLYPTLGVLLAVGLAREFVREVGRIRRGEKRFW